MDCGLLGRKLSNLLARYQRLGEIYYCPHRQDSLCIQGLT